MIYDPRSGSYLTPEQYAYQQSQLGNTGNTAPAQPSSLVSALSGNSGTVNATATAGPTIAVLMPDHSTKTFAINDPALDAALQSGARPVNGEDGGIHTDIRQFGGGWLVSSGGGWVPLNVFAGGDWLPGQQEALSSSGLPVGALNTPPNTPPPTGGPPPPIVPPSTPPPVDNGDNYGNNGWMGDPGAAAPGLSDELEEALLQMIQEARNQGVQGRERLTGLVDDYKNYLGFARAAAEQTYNRRNQLTDILLGKVTPGIESALGTMNDASGLSPEAMAALRGQAIEGTQRDYQGQVSELKTALAGRGAYGGGSTPGDFNAILGGYAPLMASRDASRSSLLSNAILSNEQRKFDTLNLNRQTALSAMNTGAGLASSMANAYNPTPLFGANEGALAGLLNTVNSGTASGFQGLNTAGNLAGVLGESQPTSFKNMLLAALAGTAADAVGEHAGEIGRWVVEGGKWLFKKIPGVGGNPNQPPPFNPGY